MLPELTAENRYSAFSHIPLIFLRAAKDAPVVGYGNSFRARDASGDVFNICDCKRLHIL